MALQVSLESTPRKTIIDPRKRVRNVKYNRIIAPKEPVREARACSRVSVKGLSSLIHREWLLAWATTSCMRCLDETCSGCRGIKQRTLCLRPGLLRRNVCDVAVCLVIVLLLTALHWIVG